MSRKVKINKDNTITVTLCGRDNTKFWTEVNKETSKWSNDGYELIHAEKEEGNSFKDGVITTLINLFRTLFGWANKHDPIVKLTFSKSKI